MEIILNMLWVLVSAAIAVAWSGQRKNRYRRLGPGLQGLALACAATFLFPVISATDDLQATTLAIETTDSKQNANKFTGNGPHPNATGSAVPDAILQNIVFRIVDSGVNILYNENRLAPSPISFPGPLEKRPPPSHAT